MKGKAVGGHGFWCSWGKWDGLLVVVVVLAVLAGCAGDQPGQEIWVVGWDCADWDQLQPMLDRGELPNLASLIEDGTAGILRSDNPMVSPILWTSIATGKTPDQHGVTWFMTDAPDGTKVPISSRERRVRAFWDMASEAGLSCGIVGWWATWPADPIQGWLVSDYVAWHSFGISGMDATSAGKTWPPELMETVAGLLPDALAEADRLLPRLVHLPPSALPQENGVAAGPYGDHLSHLRQSLATTRAYTELVLHQLDSERPQLLGVYYEGTDAMSHLFGDFAPPHLPWVTEEDFQAFSDVVDEYWKWQDELLGELLAERGPLTTVILLSDHGFRYGDERRKEEEFSIDTADADHMPDGLIVLNGPALRAGATVQGADIYDLAPTVLHLLGLPVAQDMVGSVISEAWLPEVLAAQPVQEIPTYETSPRQQGQMLPPDEQAARNMDKMLRSLGYVVGGPDEADPDSTQTVPAAGEFTAEQVVNLAVVLLRQGRAGDAVAELEEALALHPGHFEIRLNLAQALFRSGQPDRAEQIYRELIREHPRRLEVYEDLGMMLSLAGRHADALAVYDEGLVRDADWVPGLAGRGNALFRLGRLKEGRQALRAALAIDPRHHEGHFYLGLIEAESGNLRAAQELLSRAHDFEPAHVATALQLAGVLEQEGRMAQALEVLRRNLVNGGENGQVLGEIGGIQLRTGQREEAIASLNRARELEPEDVTILGNLGMARAMTGDLQAAVGLFERVVTLAPDLADGHAQLGGLYNQVDRLPDAEREMSAAVRMDPDNPVFRYNLGLVQSRAGKSAAARQSLREAIRLDDDFAAAYFNLGRLEQAAGNAQEARRLLDRARELDPRLGQR